LMGAIGLVTLGNYTSGAGGVEFTQYSIHIPLKRPIIWSNILILPM